MNASFRQLLQQHGLTASIGIFTLGLLGVIGYETQWGTSLQRTALPVDGQVAKSSESAVLPAFALPAMEIGFKETVDRPLFIPTRRPVPLVIGAGTPVMKKGQFKLAGTIMNKDLPYAFLVEIATGKGMRVAKGTDIMSTGISVDAIDAARVVLKQGEETEELTLRTAASPPPPPAPPPASAAPGVPQRQPPTGIPVGGIPNLTAPMSQPSAVTAGPLPGMGVLPGFVQSPATTPTGTVSAGAAEPATVNQRRRRFPNQPQQ